MTASSACSCACACACAGIVARGSVESWGVGRGASRVARGPRGVFIRQILSHSLGGDHEQAKRLDRRAALAVDHALGEALCGKDHPYSGVHDVDLAALSSVGADATASFGRLHFSPKNATLVITGVFDEAQVEG